MQVAQEGAAQNSAQSASLPETSIPVQNPYSDYKIIRRNGSVVGFEPSKIAVAVTKAFLAVNGSQGAGSARVRELVASLTDTVVGALIRRQPGGGTFHIEDIQDQVELALMRSGEHDVARSYVLYREERLNRCSPWHRHSRRSLPRRRSPSTRTDPGAAHPVLRCDGSGRRCADDCCRSDHVHSVCRGRLSLGLMRNLLPTLVFNPRH